MPYQVKTVDLTAVFAERELIPAQTQVAEIFVLDIPLGQVFKLRLGRNTDFISITRPFSMEPRGEQEQNNGLFIKNDTAQPGVVVEVVIVTGDSRTNTLV